jgi:hypothetical protein
MRRDRLNGIIYDSLCPCGAEPARISGSDLCSCCWNAEKRARGMLRAEWVRVAKARMTELERVAQRRMWVIYNRKYFLRHWHRIPMEERQEILREKWESWYAQRDAALRLKLSRAA